MTTRHIYVDETKERSYVLVASVHIATDVDVTRRAMRGLILRGQSRIHMAKESDRRRQQIIDTIHAADITATVYDAGNRYGSDQLAARAACLYAIVDDAGTHHTQLIIEQDDSLVRWDKQRLIELTRAAGCRETLHYRHLRARTEPLLSIPDAIAWCWARGGPWRQRIQPAITTVKQV